MRRRLLQGDAAVRIHQMLGEMPERPRLHVHDGKRAFAGGKRRAHRTAHASVIAVSGLQLVHHELDEMAFVAVERIDLRKLLQLPVYAHSGEALAAQLVEEFAVVPLAASDQRCEQQALAPMVAAHYQLDYLRIGVAHHLLAGQRRIRHRSPGEQQAQEVIDFGDGSDRGARVAASGLLLYGYDRAQAVYALHRRLLQDAHEMLGIRGESVHVAALAFGVYGIESQRRLAAAADAGHHRELSPRYVHVDVLQIVGVGSAYFYLLVHGRRTTNLRIFAYL